MEHTDKDGQKDMSVTTKSSAKLIAFLVVGIVIVVMILSGLSVYLLSPAAIRQPEVAHHHFRMQLIIEGATMDMSTSDFQETYESSICNNGLTQTPIHFHDKNGQEVHAHWGNMRGGDVLKYYGLNRIGGPSSILGFRFDQGLPKTVPVRGQKVTQSNKNMYIYQIKDRQPLERKEEDFLYQGLELFFGVKSSLTLEKEEAQQSSFIEPGGVRVSAQSKVPNDSAATFDGSKTQDELKKLNNVLGDVVIFVQDTKPTTEQVQARIPLFINLEESQCGG